jgi:hypothetical protein
MIILKKKKEITANHQTLNRIKTANHQTLKYEPD